MTLNEAAVRSKVDTDNDQVEKEKKRDKEWSESVGGHAYSSSGHSWLLIHSISRVFFTTNTRGIYERSLRERVKSRRDSSQEGKTVFPIFSLYFVSWRFLESLSQS
jgi:hypothetical protein